MKYIDADKLRNFITERFKVCPISDDERHGRHCALIEIEGFIDDFQQEQPQGLHFTPLNRLIQKIPSENWNDTVNNYAKKLCDCLINEGFRKDAEVLQGYISYMNGNNVPMATMDEQEQPEVDLKKEIDRYCEPIQAWQVQEAPFTSLDNCARHFYGLGYELGRNARKEK